MTPTTEQEPRRRIPEDVSEELDGHAHEKNTALAWFVNLFAESVSCPGPLELELSGVNVTRLLIEAFDATGGVGDMAVGYSAYYPRTDIWMWQQPKTDKQPAQRVQHTSQQTRGNVEQVAYAGLGKVLGLIEQHSPDEHAKAVGLVAELLDVRVFDAMWDRFKYHFTKDA